MTNFLEHTVENANSVQVLYSEDCTAAFGVEAFVYIQSSGAISIYILLKGNKSQYFGAHRRWIRINGSRFDPYTFTDRLESTHYKVAD